MRMISVFKEKIIKEKLDTVVMSSEPFRTAILAELVQDYLVERQCNASGKVQTHAYFYYLIHISRVLIGLALISNTWTLLETSPKTVGQQSRSYLNFAIHPSKLVNDLPKPHFISKPRKRTKG